MNSILQLPVSIFEKGLFTMNSALRTVQSAVQNVVGQGHLEQLKAPPLAGPTDMDTAVADFANRLAQIARFTHWDVSAPGTAFRKVVSAARLSFGHVDLRHPHNSAFPIQLALSFGTLFVQQGLRLFAASQVIRPSEYMQLLTDFFESFTDAPVFLALEYRELLDMYEARLVQKPGDAAARCELGRTQIKCGFNEEAASNLLQAAGSSSVRGVALHEAAVAFYRAGKFEQAAQASSGALTADPGNERARHWLWLTAQKLGGYPASIPAEHRMEVKAGYARPTVEFEDIAAKIGVDKTSAGRGLAVFDYNNDGLLDIVITAAHAGCNLYRNNGDGTFTDVSVESGIDACVNGFIIAVGDYNNDGYPDLFINRLGFYPGEGQLYRNNGDGTFTDVTQEAGLKVWGPAFATAWVDYDCDGNLDLFIANNLGGMFDRKTPNRLFHNNGDGTFTDVTEASGISTQWPTIGAAWAIITMTASRICSCPMPWENHSCIATTAMARLQT